MSENTTTVTYASAGVDVEAGDRAVELMKGAIKATHNSSVVGGVGGFAGLYDVSELVKYRKPYLATSTDGVGTSIFTTPSATTWSAWSWTTSWSAALSRCS